MAFDMEAIGENAREKRGTAPEEGGQPEGGADQQDTPPQEEPKSEEPIEEPKNSEEPEKVEAEEPQEDAPDPEPEEPREEPSENADDPKSAPEENQEEPEQLVNYKKSIEQKLYEATNGQVTDIDALIEHTTKIEKAYSEAAQQKPQINEEIIDQIDKKLQEEKGYDLQTALYWRSIDVDSLPENQKLELSMKAENPGRAQEWYARNMQKYEILSKDKEAIQDAIDDGKYTADQIEDLKVEKADMLHRSKEILSKHKEKFEINVNFDAQEPSNSENDRIKEERAAEVRAAVSDTLKNFNQVGFEVDLPKEMGKHSLQIDVDATDKHSLQDLQDGAFFARQYKTDDGFDYKKLAKDEYIKRNFDKIANQIAVNSAAEALKRYIAQKDNVQKPSERRSATDQPSKRSDILQGLGERMSR